VDKYCLSGFLFFTFLGFIWGYFRGAKPLAKTPEDKRHLEDKWTTFIVIAMILLVLGIAIYVTLIDNTDKITRVNLGILCVIVLSGAFGGLIANYYRKIKPNEVDDEEGTKSAEDNAHKTEPKVNKGDVKKKALRNIDLHVSILLGIGAAFLVPLLLHILTSNLLTDIHKSSEKGFILAGFCLAASISSEAFIGRIIQSFNKIGGEFSSS